MVLTLWKKNQNFDSKLECILSSCTSLHQFTLQYLQHHFTLQHSTLNILHIQKVTPHQPLTIKRLGSEQEALSAAPISQDGQWNVLIDTGTHRGGEVLQRLEVGRIDWTEVEDDVVFDQTL